MLRKIADGGMAEIFLAQQTGEEGFSRHVIVKRILPAFSSEKHFRDMLLDEAHIAMTLNHSNVVPVLDLGRAEGSYFLVMELVDGWDLAQICDRAHRASFGLPVGLALYIVAQVLRGLSYAHGRKDADGKSLGIVHRDVSPHNILLSEHGEVKITDFGIAKALGRRDRTQTGMIKGKLDFMSPEQASGVAIDARSDIFAAGTVLYLLATGRQPFVSTSDMEALLRVQRGEFMPPEEVRPGLSAGVCAIIRRAMKARPGDRYATAEEMMLEIEAVMRDEFGSPGQSQLKRWLQELGDRDGVLPLSRRPGMPMPAVMPESGLTARWFAEGEMLSFEDSSQIRGFEPPAPPAVSPRSVVPVHASMPLPGSMRAPAPMRPYQPPASFVGGPGSRVGPRPSWMTRSRSMLTSMSSMSMRIPRERSFLRGFVLLLLLVAGGAFGASKILSPEQKERLEADARGMWQDGVARVSALIAPPDDTAVPQAQAGPASERAPAEAAPRRAGKKSDERVTVTLVTRPANASVRGPTGALGVTPLPYTLRLGASETLTFTKPGHKSVTMEIKGSRKEKTTIVVDLPSLGGVETAKAP